MMPRRERERADIAAFLRDLAAAYLATGQGSEARKCQRAANIIRPGRRGRRRPIPSKTAQDALRLTFA